MTAVSRRLFALGIGTVNVPLSHLVALDLTELRVAQACGISATPFHDLSATSTFTPAPVITIDVPMRRGNSFVAVLDWIASTVLGAPNYTEVLWRVHTRGATALEHLLHQNKWTFTRYRKRDLTYFSSVSHTTRSKPEPRTFRASIHGRSLEFAADWGVFSGRQIDAGSMQLLEAARTLGPVNQLVDIGTGYGVLAVCLVSTDVARQAIATEIDSVGLALTIRNADAAGADVTTRLEDDPTLVEPSDLTVCNFPTHASRAEADALIRRLARRASRERVLTVVYRSLESRFLRRFAAEGTEPLVLNRATHSVLLVKGSKTSGLSRL